jgi:hypothetical protein
MTMELFSGYQWLTGVLTGDALLTSYAPGGVWRALAPNTTAPPFVIMSFQNGSDITNMNEFRLFVEATYQVKVVGPASATPNLVLAASRIDTLLGLANGTVSNGNILACWRVSPLAVDSLVNGELWSDIGGLYRLQIENTN